MKPRFLTWFLLGLLTLASPTFLSISAQGDAPFTVTRSTPSPWRADAHHPFARFHFNVTNTGSNLDYVTIPRGDIKWSDGTTALGFPSPEFGASLPPGATRPMFVHIDINPPQAGTRTATIVFKSEATGAMRTETVSIELTPPASPSATITGTVHARDGAVPGGLRVEITDLTTTMGTLPQVNVDSAGRFNVPVAPGRYAVRADSPGHSGATQMANLAAGQTATLDFVLEPGPVATVGEATITSISLSDSIWLLAASDDLARASTAPMVHQDQQSQGHFYGLEGTQQRWNLTFSAPTQEHGWASQFQALDAAISVSADGAWAAGMDWNGRVHVVEFATGQVDWSSDRAQDTNPTYPSNSPYGKGFFTSGATAFNPNASRVAAGGSNGWLILFNRDTGAVEWSKGLSAEIRALRFSPDGATLYVGAGDWKFYALNTATGDIQWTGDNEFWPFFFVAMDPEGRWVGTGSKDSQFNLWDAATGQEKWSLDVFPAFVTGGGIARGGERVLVSDWGYGVRLLDAQGRLLWFRDLSTAVGALTLDGRFALVASYAPEQGQSTIYLLDATGTTVWQQVADGALCASMVSPFPAKQIKNVLVTTKDNGTRIVGLLGCIGGGVYRLEIPVTSVRDVTVTPAPSSSASTSGPLSSATSESEPPGMPGATSPELFLAVGLLLLGWMRRRRRGP